jgi:hypothetical protein
MGESKLLSIEDIINKHKIEVPCCQICTEKLEDGNIIVLKCNDKHFFCYNCIYDWYCSILKNNYSNYSIRTQCPICRKNGGKLPLIEGYSFKNHIHYDKKYLADQKELYCYAVLKSSDKKCRNRKKNGCGDYCGLHKNYIAILPNTEILVVQETTKNVIVKCSALLKNGNKCKNKQLANGFCGIHKNNKHIISINENSNISNIDMSNIVVSEIDDIQVV